MTADRSAAPPDAPARAARPSSLLQAALRHPLVVLLVVGLGLTLGALLPVVREPDPVAQVDLLLPSAARDLQNSPEAAQQVRGQAALARLPAVAVAAAEEADVPLEQARTRLQVVLPQTTPVLRFSYRAPDEDQARRAVDAAVATYQGLRRQQLEQAATVARARAEKVSVALRTAPRTPQVLAAREELARQAGQAAVVATGGAQDDALRTPTEVELSTVSPVRGAGAGGLAALVPALAVAHALTVRQRRSRGADTPRVALAAPRLGTLRRFRLGHLQAVDPGGEATDLCRAIIDALGAHRGSGGGAPLVAVVDATQEGMHGSTFTADLAVAAADWQQLHVLVITGPESTARVLLDYWAPEAELRPQDGHRPGVIDMLEEGQPWEAVERPWDLLLADTPAMLGDGRSAATAVHADAVVAVVPRGSDVKRLLLLRRRLDELELDLVGFVELAPRRLGDLLRRRGRRRGARLRPALALVSTG